MRRFQPGETVVRREVMRGEIWMGMPQICVEDSDEVFATYLAPGTKLAFPEDCTFPAGRHPWQVAGKVEWRGNGMLSLHWEGVEHSIFVFWRGEGEQRQLDSWYFNLQDAPRRTEIGFDTLDHELDLVWDAGAPTYRWKDVELFRDTGPNRYPGRMAEIQAEGDRLARLLDAGELWWSESWAQWTPPPAWTVPSLPDNWLDVPFTAR